MKITLCPWRVMLASVLFLIFGMGPMYALYGKVHENVLVCPSHMRNCDSPAAVNWCRISQCTLPCIDLETLECVSQDTKLYRTVSMSLPSSFSYVVVFVWTVAVLVVSAYIAFVYLK